MTPYPRMDEQDLLILEQRRNPAPNSFSKDTPDPGPESRLLNKCLNYCKERGYPAWHDRSRGKNEPHWPDMIIFVPGGRPILVETKSAKGIFRTGQQELARRFMYLKYRYFKVKSFTAFIRIMEENHD